MFPGDFVEALISIQNRSLCMLGRVLASAITVVSSAMVLPVSSPWAWHLSGPNLQSDIRRGVGGQGRISHCHDKSKRSPCQGSAVKCRHQPLEGFNCAFDFERGRKLYSNLGCKWPRLCMSLSVRVSTNRKVV